MIRPIAWARPVATTISAAILVGRLLLLIDRAFLGTA
jgi:hypothetical protein